jgi:hypothetical protein
MFSFVLSFLIPFLQPVVAGVTMQQDSPTLASLSEGIIVVSIQDHFRAHLIERNEL